MITIRPFELTDKPAVINLWHECGLVVAWNDPEKDIQRKLAVNPELFLVALVDDTLVGTVMGGYEGHRGWINYMAVLPDHQGKGIGRQLIEQTESNLLALGCPKINLQVRSTNTQIIEYYKTLGFSEDHAVGMGKRLIPDN
jgi:ribosomal protein S18 acetylase RimI-like enzyme